MRLHRLEVQALQAFAATEVVDFDALGAGGLFLLHGDTGAGKTTLLDAICFAFYGRLPGARGKDTRERSDHAAPELRTQVVLEATLRGERLRITRSPKQERPKLRGSGMTSENATVHLERLDGTGWTTLATRADEAGLELERLLGMTREQFCQVVLLPQGEFATFLRATSDERWVVLERLFATERFGVAEDVMKQRRFDAMRALDAARGAVGDIAQRLCQEVSCDPDPSWESEPGALAPWLQERLVGAEASLITATSACERAAGERSVADTALAAAVERAERAARHAAAVTAVDEHLLGRASYDAWGVELFDARAASAVLPLLDEDDRRTTELARAEAAAAAALGALGRLVGEPDALRQEAAQHRAALGEVRAVAGLEADLAARRGALASEDARAAGARLEAEQATEALGLGPARKVELTAVYEQTKADADASAARGAAAQDAYAKRDAAVRRDALVVELADLEPAHVAAVGRAQALKAAWLDVREARLAGIAAELAGRLVDGEACTVCGATEHPAPAAPAGPGADEAAERAAEARHETALAELEALATQLAARRTALAAATALAGPDDLAELERVALVSDRARDLSRRAQADVGARAAALTAHEQEQATLAQARSTALQVVAEATGRAEAWRAEIEADTERLRTVLGGAASVAVRSAVLLADAAACEVAADAVGAVSRARGAAEEARARVLGAAKDAGFGDLPAARAAARSTAECEALEARRRAWEDGLAERRALAADPELVAAAAAEQADLQPLRDAARAAAGAQALAEREHEVAKRHAHALRTLEGQLEAALVALAPVAEKAKRVRELAYLVDGSSAANTKRMRLSAYVLAARLEAIAEAATVRLAEMTAGRYAIEHADDGARGHKRGGLDLRIVDAWTGSARNPATLSGGETFLASLALALGLADVVAAESGGARLETLFVDEGFGSLDPDSLDLVMDVLDGLRDGGRAVGIVSHVAELRQRVPSQLHVVKGRAGSTLAQPSAA